MTGSWKKGRGKLGFLDPLIGSWKARTISDNGPVRCVRTFAPVLKGTYVELDAHWKVGPVPAGKSAAKPEPGTRREAKSSGGGDGAPTPGGSYTYDEVALIGAGGDRNVRFWSFTSDGKHTHGTVADGTDLHPDAIAFEATVMGRVARQVYFPGDDGTMIWVVEAKAKKGWNRFVEHRYKRIDAEGTKPAAAKSAADTPAKTGKK